MYYEFNILISYEYQWLINLRPMVTFLRKPVNYSGIKAQGSQHLHNYYYVNRCQSAANELSHYPDCIRCWLIHTWIITPARQTNPATFACRFGVSLHKKGRAKNVMAQTTSTDVESEIQVNVWGPEMEMRSDLKADSGNGGAHLWAKIFSQLALCFGPIFAGLLF